MEASAAVAAFRRLPRAIPAGIATVLLGGVLVWAGSTFGVASVTFAFAVNWLVMCWMGIVSRLYPPRLPERYFAIRPFERTGRLYGVLGVRAIKLVVRRGPLHWFNPHLRLPAEPTAERLRRLEGRMREPETAHVWLFGIMLVVVGHALARGWWPAAAWTMVFNVVLNVYPVMLQRYNRRWLLGRIATAGAAAPATATPVPLPVPAPHRPGQAEPAR